MSNRIVRKFIRRKLSNIIVPYMTYELLVLASRAFPPRLEPTWMLSLQDIPSLARDEKTPAKWLKNIDYALEATVALSQAAILSDPRHMIDSFFRSAL
ncbi:hypothetical protein AVEN_253590-1 [Araneus ventricosus]|uniref:Uncharacterized protein n=1 Tax=Araneus ventricosus TaxID=182803 RepID=A0A4Y2C9T1_ARAVE|nr:hypothetical protein AVEN_253590-1 [Araneus ventricosus]